jgi:ATP-dependent Clp protease protease subunit
MAKRAREQATKEEGLEENPNKPSRRVYIFGRLENEVALPVIRRLLRFNDRDREAPIDMYINSSGGNGYNADAIIAVMQQIEAPINTICLGHALSGACEILAAGTGKRSAFEFSTVMFHQTIWEAEGDITNLEIQAAQGQRFREAQVELLHRCTGQEKSRLRRDIERDHYMSAQEALSYGIIDEIIPHKAGTSGSPRRVIKTLSNAVASKKTTTAKKSVATKKTVSGKRSTSSKKSSVSKRPRG